MQYLEEINSFKLLSQDQVDELVARIKNEDLNKRERDEARKRLIQSNLRLVVFTAKKFVGRGFDLEDLISEGNLGLIRAIEDYDPAKGMFSTYANYWIKQRIHAMIDEGGMIRLPRYLTSMVRNFRIARRLLKKKLNREPKLQEIADQIGVKKFSKCFFKAIHLKARLDDRDDIILLNVAGKFVPETCLEEIRIALGKIHTREANIISLHYGLESDKLTLDQIGLLYGITRERTRQIEREGLLRLRKFLGG